jgi:hypothetical protein
MSTSIKITWAHGQSVEIEGDSTAELERALDQVISLLERQARPRAASLVLDRTLSDEARVTCLNHLIERLGGAVTAFEPELDEQDRPRLLWDGARFSLPPWALSAPPSPIQHLIGRG